MPVHEHDVKAAVKEKGLAFDAARQLVDGHHAKVVIEFSGNGDGQPSHVVKWIAVSKAGEYDATMLMQSIVDYRHQLKQHDVPIVEVHWLFPKELGEDYYLVEIAEHGGPTIEGEIIEATLPNALATVRATLETVERLFSSATSHILPVGLNFVPRNFTRDPVTGKIRYIDYFFPYVYPFLTWPPSADPVTQALEQFRHYDVRGLLQVYLVQIGRLRPELRDQTEQLIETRIDRWGLRVGTWWQERPAKSLRRVLNLRSETSERAKRKARRRARRLIEGLHQRSIYDLRDCAVLMASRGMLDQPILRHVFDQTHFDAHEPLSKEHFIEQRTKLASLI